MADIEKIRSFVEGRLEGGKLFLVSVAALPSGEVEVVIDSDGSVGIDACVELSRAVEAEFGQGDDDFALTVTSAGIGQPLKLLRQYRKLLGRQVEVLRRSGGKMVATLDAADESSITVTRTEMKAVEGAKRKQKATVTERLPLEEIKWTKEYIDF